MYQPEHKNWKKHNYFWEACRLQRSVMDGRDVSLLEEMVCKNGCSHDGHYLANPTPIFRPKNCHWNVSVLSLQYCPDQYFSMGPPKGAQRSPIPKVLTRQEIWKESWRTFQCCMLLAQVNNRLCPALCCSQIPSSRFNVRCFYSLQMTTPSRRVWGNPIEWWETIE